MIRINILIILLFLFVFALGAACVFLTIFLHRKRTEYKKTLQELLNDYEKKAEVMQQNYTNTIQQLQEEKKAICKEYDDRIQHSQEDIENRKNQLLLMEEKELLVRIMMALNSYATRFDRLEKHLSIDEITRKNSELVQNITAKQTELEKSFVEQLVGFKASVNNSINDSELIRKLNEISAEAISARLSCIMYNMESEISKMTSQLTNQIGNMNASVTKSLNNSELPKRLDRFEYEIKGILSRDNKYNSLSEQIEELIDRINSMKSNIEDMKSNVCEGTSSYTLCAAIDDIHNSVCDRYGYDSIASNLDNILSAVQEAKEAAESTKDIVESHFY